MTRRDAISREKFFCRARDFPFFFSEFRLEDTTKKSSFIYVLTFRWTQDAAAKIQAHGLAAMSLTVDF